jgi:hypothetical protein
MARSKKERRRNKGWFKKGKDPRRRVGFTQEEAKRGYRRPWRRSPTTSTSTPGCSGA